MRDFRAIDELPLLEDCNAVAYDERLAQLLAEDEDMSNDSSDNYFEEDGDDRDEEQEVGLNVGSSELGDSEIKIENVDMAPENEKSAIESDDDVIIIDIDSDSKTNPKDGVDKIKQKHATEKDSGSSKVTEKDPGNSKVKEQIGKYLAEQKKVMQFGTSSPGASGSVIKSVPSKQRNTSRSLVKRSGNVQRGYPHDKSRKEALKTSLSLLNKPLSKVLLDKRKDGNSKGPSRQSGSAVKKRQYANESENDSDDEANVTVKTEPSWSVKAGEVDLRFSDSGRIRFDNGKCRYSEDERAEIIRYTRKHGAEAASKMYNVPCSTVRSWQNSNIGKFDRRKCRKYSDVRKAEIIAYANKHGIRAAVEVYNVPLNTVRYWHYSCVRKIRLNHVKGRSKYSEEEKANILQYAIDHGKVAASKKYKVPFGTVSVWISLKRKQDANKANKVTAVAVKRRMLLHQNKGGAKFGEEIEMKIVAWIKEKHKRQEYVSGNMVRSYCLSLVKHKLPKFKATMGWLDAFLTRNHLKNHIMDTFKGGRSSGQPVPGTSKAPEEVTIEDEVTHPESSKDSNATKSRASKQRKKRRKFTEVQKASILRYATVRSVRAACLLYKVQPSQLYAWKATKALIKDTRIIKSQIDKKFSATSNTGKASNNDTVSENTQNDMDNSDYYDSGTENLQSDFIEKENQARDDNINNTEGDDSGPDKSGTDRVNINGGINTTLNPKIHPNPNPKLNKSKRIYRGKSVIYGDKIDHEIFWWIINQGKQGKEVSGDMIREYALSLVKHKLPNLNFKASDGWMRSFLRRHNLELHFSKN